MSWQRGGRVLVAAVGIGTAVALYVTTRERPVIERPALPADIDPVASVQTGQGVELNYVHDVERWRLSYQSRKLVGEHVEFETVHILFKQDGTEVWADKARVRGATGGQSEPASLEAEGHVRFRTGEGATVEGESLIYEQDNEVSRMAGPVTFTRGRASGSGTGAVYERHAGVFRILADAHVTLVPEGEAGTHVEATSSTMTFNRANRAMLFEENARIQHDVDLLTADRATLYLSEDEQQFQVIELRGNSKVLPNGAPGPAGNTDPGVTGNGVPASGVTPPVRTPPGSPAGPPASTPAPSDTPEMEARDIDLAFYAGTQALERAVLSQQARLVQTSANGPRSVAGNLITLATAPDGATLTHLEARENVVVLMPAAAAAPERQVRSAALVATGSARAGLTNAVFTGGVRFDELGPARGGTRAVERSGTSARLTLALDGGLDAIEEAHFQEDVAFEDGSVSGYADSGTYSVQSGVLKLQPHPQRPDTLPRVTDGDMRVDASRLIEVNLNTHDLQAEGDVKTQTRRREADTKGASRPALFDGPDPVLGFGDRFWYVRANEQVRYTGTARAPARLRQGESMVEGNELVLDDTTRDLHATGRVTSRLPIERGAGEPSGAKPILYRGSGERMVYLDAARTLEYVGLPATLETPDGRTTAAHIVIRLSKEGRTLEQLEARSDPADALTASVHSVLSKERQALSDSLHYDAATDRYTLRGNPAVLRWPNEDGTCTELRAAIGHFTGTAQASFSEEENPGGTKTFTVPCSRPLTR